MAKRIKAGKTKIKKLVVSLPLFIYQVLRLFSKPSKEASLHHTWNISPGYNFWIEELVFNEAASFAKGVLANPQKRLLFLD